MIKVGEYNTLKVIREAAFGLYLDDGNDGILLPKRFVSKRDIGGYRKIKSHQCYAPGRFFRQWADERSVCTQKQTIDWYATQWRIPRKNLPG